MQSTSRNEVKQLAQTLENLARQVQTLLDAGDNIMLVANELARNSSTFVFALGSMYAVENGATTSSHKVKAKGPGTISTSLHRNFHNVRDTHGRFTRKI
jgi:glucosamine 6-phosphate synthetase-like amidotransferase/phosphosugar isomerase protein